MSVIGDRDSGIPPHPQTAPPAVRFDDYVAVHGIVVTPCDDFDGYAVTVGLPPDWAVLDTDIVGELPGKQIWAWPNDPLIERFGANAVLSLSRVTASLDPAEVFAMLCESQKQIVAGTRERSRALRAATDGPGVDGLQLLEISTEDYGRVASASRTRIVPAAAETLIAQLTITALVDSPVDFADTGLSVAPGAAGGPAPLGYHGAGPAPTAHEDH
jgi:hypothetical protein